MARILVATFPAVGHVSPFFPLVRALAARGHELVWLNSPVYHERITEAGARPAPFQRAHDFAALAPGERLAERKRLAGVAALKADLHEVFIANAPRQVADLRAVADTFRPDMLLIDSAFVGGMWYHELTGTPVAILGVLPLGLSSRDVAPSGLGLPPDATPAGRLRNRALGWAIEHALFRDVQSDWNRTRAALGLPPTGWFQDTAARAQLFMQLSVPGFEYPRGDLAPTVHFIGAMPAQAPAGWEPPAWWGEIAGGRPVVHVTQGTVANRAPTLIAPALEGLAGEEVLVVVSTGGRAPGDLGLAKVPANARVGTFLSYPQLLPRTDAVVTNGGYGGVQAALAHGVPLAVAGTTEDKLEVAARVAWSGAGISLRTDSPRPEQVRDAVRALLTDRRYRTRALALREEYLRLSPVERGVQLVERLAATGRPVLREPAAAPAAQPHAAAAPQA